MASAWAGLPAAAVGALLTAFLESPFTWIVGAVVALPIFVLVGLRSYYAYRKGQSRDSAPRFAESIVQAWQIPYVVFEDSSTGDDLAALYERAMKEGLPQVVFMAE